MSGAQSEEKGSAIASESADEGVQSDAPATEPVTTLQVQYLLCLATIVDFSSRIHCLSPGSYFGIIIVAVCAAETD